MRPLWQAIHDTLRDYKGGQPLALFLAGFYRLHPKLGSRDRRIIGDALYCFYRASKGFSGSTSEEQLVQASLLLCGTSEHARALLPEHWQAVAEGSFERKLRVLEKDGLTFTVETLFPYGIQFSKGIRTDDWKEALLHQPKLFLRLRVPVKEVTPLLEAANIPFETPIPGALALPNGTAIKDVLPEESYVVMDLSSQRTAEYLRPAPHENWWDACAGSGGKSIMLKDMQAKINLIVTDIRPNILQNLTTRFRRYKLVPPETHVVDAADAPKVKKALGSNRFEAVLTDVPCTGSGTWGRTPEGAYFFDPATLANYTARQRAIVANAVYYLKPGGRIVYATCSVFRAENEEVVEGVAKEKGLTVEASHLISGIGHDADSLYVAILERK
jgi:16S rRNA (cytosine967-C5)-methyltransferase